MTYPGGVFTLETGGGGAPRARVLPTELNPRRAPARMFALFISPVAMGTASDCNHRCLYCELGSRQRGFGKTRHTNLDLGVRLVPVPNQPPGTSCPFLPVCQFPPNPASGRPRRTRWEPATLPRPRPVASVAGSSYHVPGSPSGDEREGPSGLRRPAKRHLRRGTERPPPALPVAQLFPPRRPRDAPQPPPRALAQCPELISDSTSLE